MFSRITWRFPLLMAYQELDRRNKKWISENVEKKPPQIPRRLTVTLVRHGETEFNSSHKLQGWVDTPLSEVGMKQAKELGYSLRHEVYDMAYSSDLKRAIQTLQQIQSQTLGYKTAPSQDQRLRERGFGTAENTDNRRYREVAVETMGLDKEHLYTPIGGETYEQIVRRIEDFLVDLFQMIDEDEGEVEFIVIVSHGYWILTFMRYLIENPDLFMLENFDESIAKVAPRNTAISKFDIYPKTSNGRRLIRFSEMNNYRHLSQPPLPPFTDKTRSKEPQPKPMSKYEWQCCCGD